MQIEQGGSMSRPISQPVTPGVPSRTGGQIVIATPTTRIAKMRFNGKTVSGNYTLTGSGDFTTAEMGTKSTSEDCIILGGNSAQPVQIGAYYICASGGVNSDGKLILFAGTLLTSLIKVRVKADGGSAGDAGVFPTFTYSIYAEDDTSLTTAIATAVAVQQRLIPVKYRYLLNRAGTRRVWHHLVSRREQIIDGATEDLHSIDPHF